MKEIIKTMLRDFHVRGTPPFIERSIHVPLDSKKVVSLIGPRRAGKTYILYQTMAKIADKTNIVYLNFEDERLDLQGKDMGIILDAFFELYPAKKEKDLYFFFDEIQEIKDWEKFVRRIYDTISQNIFITGSSAKLLSKEIATSLRGRTITYEIFPLSFTEYLKFKGIEQDIYATRNKAAIIEAFTRYLTSSSFPELLLIEPQFAEKTLQAYLDVMIFRDIAERYSVTNIIPLKEFVKILLSNTAKEFSVNKIFHTFKTKGVSISKDSLYKYVDYANDAFVVLSLPAFSESLRKQKIGKIYTIDNGLSLLLSFALGGEKGNLLETLVFLELRRRSYNISYYKNGCECDFLVKEKDKITHAVQVCLELTDDNKAREIGGLQKVMQRFNLKKGLLMTKDQEGTEGNISIIPAWKWLLQENLFS